MMPSCPAVDFFLAEEPGGGVTDVLDRFWGAADGFFRIGRNRAGGRVGAPGAVMRHDEHRRRYVAIGWRRAESSRQFKIASENAQARRAGCLPTPRAGCRYLQ